MKLLSVISSSLLLAYSGSGGGCCIFICHGAFVAPPRNIAPHSKQLLPTPRLLKLNAEEPNSNNALDELQPTKASTNDLIVNSSFNDDAATLSEAAEIAAAAEAPPPPPLPIEFDPTNPEALIAITKSFIASDFGIQRQTTSSSASSQRVRHFLSSIILHTLVCD